MGYSKNEASINRVKSLLDQMVAAKTDLTWPTKDAHMLGYHLREAMTLAQKIGKAPYDKLKDRFTIRNRGDRVVAELKLVETVQALQQLMSKMELPELHTVVEIVGAAIAHDAGRIYFPDAVLMDEDKKDLYGWTSKHGYHLIVAEVGVTITKDDPGEAAWTP
jgi:hypothetical protein